MKTEYFNINHANEEIFSHFFQDSTESGSEIILHEMLKIKADIK